MPKKAEKPLANAHGSLRIASVFAEGICDRPNFCESNGAATVTERFCPVLRRRLFGSGYAGLGSRCSPRFIHHPARFDAIDRLGGP